MVEIIETTEPWTADEVAEFLGVKKNQANGWAKYTLAMNGGLMTIIKQMIESHEEFKKKRLGLKNGIIIPDVVPNPFKKG